MLKYTPRTYTYLKHITKEPNEKVWSTYMEISLAKTDRNKINFVYESTRHSTKNKGSRTVENSELVDFGNIANQINPRMHEFLKEVRSRLELSQINLFDQAIITSLNKIGNDALESLFRVNFEKEQQNKKEKVKKLYSSIK